MYRLSRVLEYLQQLAYPALVCDAERLIAFANEPLAELSGYSSQELIGQSPVQLLQGPETDPATVQRVRDKLDVSTPFGFSITNHRSDGSAYAVGVFVIPLLSGERSQRSERFEIGLCRELLSVAEAPLSKSAPGFNAAVAHVLDIVESDQSEQCGIGS